MAATPYKGTMTFQGVALTKKGLVPTGRTYIENFSADDVAGARIDFDKTGSEEVSFPEAVRLVDITTSADGVDTKRVELYADGQQTTYQWRIGGLKDAIQQPHIITPPVLPMRARIQFYQRA